MIKSFRKAIVMVIVITMGITSAALQSGCDSQNNVSSAVSSTSAAASSTTVKPVVLKILAGTGFENPVQGVQNDPVAKEIEKQLGITMDITSSSAVGDVDAKISAMIASGDLPDVTLFPNQDLMKAAVTAKVVLPLDDLIVQYGKDMLKNVPDMIANSKKMLSKDSSGNADGKFYFIANEVGALNFDPLRPQYAPAIRWDLYKKLGYPKVDQLNDYIPLMKQMLALEPTNKDGQKNYGIGVNFADGAWTGDEAIWGASMMYGTCPGYNMSDVSKSTTDSTEINYLSDPSSPFFKMIEFFNKANQAGLLDPDSFIMKDANLQDKYSSGRYMMAVIFNKANLYNQEMIKAGVTDKGFVTMPIPSDSTSCLVSWYLANGRTSFAWGVSAKSENPDKAVQLFNFLSTYEGVELLKNGVKGVDWNEENGKPVVKAENIEKMMSDNTFKTTSGIQKYPFFNVLGEMNTDPKYGTYLNFYNNPVVAYKRLTAVEKDQCAYFKINVPLDLVTSKYKDIIQNLPERAAMSKGPKDIDDKAVKIDNYYFNNYTRMILAKNDEQYKTEQDKFIKDVKALGYDELVQWRNTELARAKASIKK